ncbi:serine/arginine repetitive matrix protein 1-like isoform X5 [Branchiostoma floridae]|uniref:Serine/arginine repetitive matrix protein 1-like isoform X5 n=1 Tax=Branchiostoma floridae TaxID=7739 RepID=A0A9J7L5G5_BRAFL|nr:serine/arginine repetitive matrix protein 1-like isoform X5 [Branchiostoma floridae]
MAGLGLKGVYVPASQHTLFIRGLRGDTDKDEIIDFFTKHGGKCSFDFFKQSDNKEVLFVALRFQRRDIAKDIFNKYNGKLIFGSRVQISWFKDFRRHSYSSRGHFRGRWQGKEQHFKRGTAIRTPGAHNLSGARGRGPMGFREKSVLRLRAAANPFIRKPGYRQFSSGDDEMYRAHSHSRSPSSRRTHSSHSPERRRQQSPQKHRSLTPVKHRSMTPTGHRSVSPQRYRSSATPPQQHMDPSRHHSMSPMRQHSPTSPHPHGRDYMEEYSPNMQAMGKRSRSSSLTRDHSPKRLRSSSYGDYIPEESTISHPPAGGGDNMASTSGMFASPGATAGPSQFSQSPLKRSVSPDRGGTSIQDIKRGLPARTPPRTSTSSTPSTPSNSHPSGSDSAADTPSKSPKPPAKKGSKNAAASKAASKNNSGKASPPPASKKMTSEGKGGENSNTASRHASGGKAGSKTLSKEDLMLKQIRKKRREIEEAYRQDCETIGTVCKMLITKDPTIEEKLSPALKECLKDLGDRCIQELKDAIKTLEDKSSS